MTSATPTLGTDTDSAAPSRVGRTLVAFWAVATMVGLAWWLLNPDGLFFALGSLASLLVSLPLTRRYTSVVSPWTLVAAFTYVGCGVRGAAITAGIDTTDRVLSQFFLLQREPDYFLAPTVMYVSATAIMTATFMLRPRTERAPKCSRPDTLFRGPVVGLAIPLALIGTGSFVAYVRTTGGLDVARISAKRTLISGLDLDESYTTHGELLFLNNFASIAFWIVIAYYVSSGRRLSPTTKEGWFTAALGLNAIALPFYASSRTDAVLTLLIGAGIAMMLSPKRIPVKWIILGGAGVLLVVSTITHLRPAQHTDPDITVSSALVDGAAEAFIYSRNLADPTVTAHVYHAVPETIPHQNGGTITAWALAPIPRAIWPEKPHVNFGPVLGSVIYGYDRSGVPPGWVGDLYLNWGLPAVLVGSALIGWILARIDRWRLRQAVYTPAFAMLYLPFALTFATNVMSKGIGAAFFNGGILFVLTALCLVWLGALSPRAERREAPTAST